METSYSLKLKEYKTIFIDTYIDLKLYEYRKELEDKDFYIVINENFKYEPNDTYLHVYGAPMHYESIYDNLMAKDYVLLPNSGVCKVIIIPSNYNIDEIYIYKENVKVSIHDTEGSRKIVTFEYHEMSNSEVYLLQFNKIYLQ